MLEMRRKRWRERGGSSFAGITRYFPGGRVTDCVNWLLPAATAKRTTGNDEALPRRGAAASVPRRTRRLEDERFPAEEEEGTRRRRRQQRRIASTVARLNAAGCSRWLFVLRPFLFRWHRPLSSSRILASVPKQREKRGAAHKDTGSTINAEFRANGASRGSRTNLAR